jgi:signal transduction histidine kinase
MFKIKTFRRSLLLGFMLSAFLPLVCLGYVSYSYLKFKTDEFGKQSNELLADTVATEVSSFFRSPLIAMEQLVILFKSTKLSAPQINTILDETVSESDYIEAVYIVNEKKRVIHIGLDEGYRSIRDNYLDLDLSGLSILRNVEYVQGPYWSNSFLSPVSGKNSIALISPVDKSRFIIGLINIEYLHSSILNKTERRETSTIILDENGTPVFHPQLRIVEEQQSFAALVPFREAQIGKFGTHAIELNNVQYIGSTANIPETKWLVMIVQQRATAEEPLRNMTNFFLLVAFFSVIVVVILALRQSRRLLKPLNILQENIKAVAGGDYQANISRQSHAEFEEVATLFRHMAAAIERREQLLEINEERLISLLEVHNLKQLAENELLEFAMEQAVSLTRSEIGYLHVYNDEEKNIGMTLWSKNVEIFCDRYGFAAHELKGFGFGRETIENRRYIIRNSKNDGNGNPLETVGRVVLRHLSVPIFDGKKMVAVIGVLNKKTKYDKSDARQLSLYFNHTWDILQQKRYERDRSRMADQLAHAQKLEAIGTLAGGIAHDFNNVLMVIIGNTELAKDNIGKPEKIRRDLDEIFKGALRARDLVNQILAFSRHTAEGLRPLDIRPIVKEAVKLLRSSIPANIEIRHDIAKESYPVVSEPGKINQLIMNLCTNAYQAMDDKDGTLWVRLQPVFLESDLYNRGKMVAAAGEYMQLVIGDSGKGIPEEMIDRIFEPYFTTREKERGTGLGLAVVHGVVKGLKGAIIVDSELGRGATFSIYLPVAKTESQGEEQVITGSLPGGDEHILYVDDDESVALVNSKILESLGYRVSTFFSSRAAFEHFSKRTQEYDLVITDMAMPEMSGDVLAGKILEIRGDLPVILCTGYSEKMDQEKAEEIGIGELMMKPLTRLDLALTIRKLLGFSSR